jgi:hypothetical protein
MQSLLATESCPRYVVLGLVRIYYLLGNMSKIKIACWGLLAALGVGAIEPAFVNGAEDASASSRMAQLAATLPNLPTSGVFAISINANRTVAQAVPVDAGLANIFTGNKIPTSIKLKDLNPEWRGMGTNGPVEIGNLQMLVNTSAGGSFAATYYTKGQTVTIGSETYIVAYSLLSVADKVTPELPLNLSLLNLKTIGSLTNIRPFEVAKETKVLEKQLAMIQLANVFDPTKSTEPSPETTPTVEPTPEVRPSTRPTRKPRRRTRTRRPR